MLAFQGLEVGGGAGELVAGRGDDLGPLVDLGTGLVDLAALDPSHLAPVGKFYIGNGRQQLPHAGRASCERLLGVLDLLHPLVDIGEPVAKLPLCGNKGLLFADRFALGRYARADAFDLLLPRTLFHGAVFLFSADLLGEHPDTSVERSQFEIGLMQRFAQRREVRLDLFDGPVHDAAAAEAVDDLLLLPIGARQEILVAVAREDKGREKLVARDAQPFEDIAVGGVHALERDLLQHPGHSGKAAHG